MENQSENNSVVQNESRPGVSGREKLTRKERKQRWKAAKKAKKDALKEYYRYAPAGKRLWNLHLKKPVCVLLVLAIVFGLLAYNMSAIYSGIVVPILRAGVIAKMEKPLTAEQQEQMYQLCPIDEEGAAKIDAEPAAGENDTWTICVYIVGSDLEDNKENDLSYVTSMEVSDERDSLVQAKSDAVKTNLLRFKEELDENGLELPAFFYYPDFPVASSKVVTEEVVVATREGAASKDIGEMRDGVWSENINIVIQTGGATRWSNQMVNPNRTQRFCYHNGLFEEVYNGPLQRASNPESLADFIRFCRDEYPSDHRMLVLWNHGGGQFGFGYDTIYKSMMTLQDVRDALASVYRPSKTNPAFDIIGFDACLMSTLEVTNALDGFADYYCLSEESEPNDGWDYAPWLQALSDNPSMSPAQVARAVADSYMDFYMSNNVKVPMFQDDVTFSVIHAQKASELYKAYCSLAEAQLRDAAEDMSVLAEIGKCGRRATHYAGSGYNIMNSIDLGNYADYMSDSYPEECAAIRDLIGEAVLYHRECGALSDSTGIAVYLPTEVKTIDGLVQYLKYVYDVSQSDAVTALYYYKQAGCLTPEMKEYVATLTDAEPATLDVTPFREFTSLKAEYLSTGFQIPVSDELQKSVTDYELLVGRYDEDGDVITYYGFEDTLTFDGEGMLVNDFDGTWITLGDEPLYVEIISSTASAVEYRAHVKYDGSEAYLMISRNRDTDELAITGIRKVPEDPDINYLYSTRTNEEVEIGATIIPLYDEYSYRYNTSRTAEGNKIRFSDRTALELRALPDGYYLSAAVISDQRGDRYYSTVAGSSMSHGGMGDWAEDLRFYGRDY